MELSQYYGVHNSSNSEPDRLGSDFFNCFLAHLLAVGQTTEVGGQNLPITIQKYFAKFLSGEPENKISRSLNKNFVIKKRKLLIFIYVDESCSQQRIPTTDSRWM